MAVDTILRLRLDVRRAVERYNTGLNIVESLIGEDIYDTILTTEIKDPMIRIITLAKDDADIEIVPVNLQSTGLNYLYLRILWELFDDVSGLTPADGSMLVKITHAGGTDQIAMNAGRIFEHYANEKAAGLITSVKITSNEDDATGVDVPLLIILAGKP